MNDKDGLAVAPLIKARKLCDAFGVNVVNVPHSNERRFSELVSLQQRITNMRTLLTHAKLQRIQMIARASKRIDDWFVYVAREKAIYTTMNLCSFDSARSSLIANGWMLQVIEMVVKTKRMMKSWTMHF